MVAIRNVQKSFGTKSIANGITFQFTEGVRYALVGVNGCGKSSLLKIIAGEDQADAGEVVFSQGDRMGYLAQHPRQSPETSVLNECVAGAEEIMTLRRRNVQIVDRLQNTHDDNLVRQLAETEDQLRQLGSSELEGRAARILSGLGFSDRDLNKDPQSLSGGWRMRLELARLLVQEPTFMILDEPTNHLDLPSLVWFERYLMNYRGTVLLVSHDRELIDRLGQVTLHLERGDMTPYQGNFSYFLDERARIKAERAAQREQLASKREQLEKFVERFGAKATKAAQAQSKQKMIDRLQAMEDDLGEGPESAAMHLRFPTAEKSSRMVFRAEKLQIGYEGRALPCAFDFEIERGMKVAIIGANGLGKSTLLRTLASHIKPVNGKVELGTNVAMRFFAQEQTHTLNFEKDVLANVLEQTPLGEKDARQILGALLFRGSDIEKKAKVLSGGERSRLAMALVLGQRANLLLLDEPTNHLDLTSVEVLAEAVANFDGTVVFVSHDRGFIDGVATHVLALAPDGTTLFCEGNLHDFPLRAKSAGFPDLTKPPELTGAGEGKDGAEKAKAVDYERQKAARNRKQKLLKDISGSEAMQAKLRAQVEKAEAELSSADFANASEIRRLNDILTSAKASLETEELRWIDMSSELESLAAENF